MYVVVGIIVLLAIVFFAMSKKKDVEEAPIVDNTTEGTDVEGVNEVDTSSPEKALTYQQALVKYKDKRIHFTADCQASPDRQVFNVGTTIMLDNRAPKSLTVKVGSTYTLGRYGFKIITLNTKGTLLVDCGTSQNVATVIVQ